MSQTPKANGSPTIPTPHEPSNPSSNDTIPNLEAEADADIDVDADADIEMAIDNEAPADQTSSSTLTIDQSTQPPDIAPNMTEPAATDISPALDAAEARIAQKKDSTLREFLGRMDDYAPIIPDALTAHYLTMAGLPPPPATPLALSRLLALATQKFIADIAADAYQYARIRSGHSTAANAGLAAAAAAGVGGAGVGPAAGVVPGAGASSGATGTAGAGGKGVTLGAQRPGYGGGGAGAAGATGGAGAGTGAQGRTVLTMEDLGMAVGEYGVNVKRGEFYR